MIKLISAAHLLNHGFDFELHFSMAVLTLPLISYIETLFLICTYPSYQAAPKKQPLYTGIASAFLPPDLKSKCNG
ncbi:hypothetical protein [Schleiferilactobacillus harbinensis]|uniref:Uncharacterized protein n=1 Tax=Schleiferilactobacillus harbinensis TaxID=304207 RepID=A0A5P8MAW2_9LACO|nr:hypothetical protein [Schleiferilactobacillus harbinensis]QFR25071.1 hypothetical protein D1010_17700 [Schleiferilactobacillus harbinensis]